MESCDVGAILNVMYKARINLRIQNHLSTGFYGRVSHDRIFYRCVSLEDFSRPGKDIFHVSASSIAEMDKWYFSKSLNNLCQFFFKEISNQIPRILEYVEGEEPSGVEAILTNAHTQGYQFIIESVWDFGYDVFLLRKDDELCYLREFNSDEITEIAEWIDVEMSVRPRELTGQRSA